MVVPSGSEVAPETSPVQMVRVRCPGWGRVSDGTTRTTDGGMLHKTPVLSYQWLSGRKGPLRTEILGLQ